MPAESSVSPVPDADQFPELPASWYLFCKADKLRHGPLSRDFSNRRMVAYRSATGCVTVLDARCAHLGADLGLGAVEGECLRCPYHHWLYDSKGDCREAPGLATPPPGARLRVYPTLERHGLIFFFNGQAPLFPLPFFQGETAGDYVAGRPFRYVADCSWYMNAAHAFDTQHFLAVHERRLLAPPVTDHPETGSRRNRYRAEVLGRRPLDWLLRRLAGSEVEISLTISGGTFAVITGDFARARSRFLISMTPLSDGSTLCEGVVFKRRGSLPGVRRFTDPLSLWIRRAFTFGYLKAEAASLRGTRYRPEALTVADQDMADFFRWVVRLPQTTVLEHDNIRLHTTEGDAA